MIDDKRITPFKAWYKKQPAIDHIRVWGSKYIVHIPEKKQKSKLHPRGKAGLFVKYTKTVNQYQIYLIKSQKIRTYNTKVVVFNESSFGTTNISLDFNGSLSLGGEIDGLPQNDNNLLEDADDESLMPSNFREALDDCLRPQTSLTFYTMSGGLDLDRTIRAPVPKRSSIPVGAASAIPSVAVMINATPTNRNIPNHSAITPATETVHQPEAVKPSHTKIDTVDLPNITSMQLRSAKRLAPLEDHEDEPIKKSARVHQAVEEDALVYCTVEQETDAHDADAVHHGIDNPVPIPTSYQAAINDPIHGPHWRAVFEKEITDITANDTFEIVNKPPDTNIVTARWVWTVKYTSDQLIDRYKARLVARGFTQVYGQDYWETFAPTIRADSLRLLLAIMAIEDMEADQADVNNAFTKSRLTEKIYMHPPEGIKVPKDRVLLMRKSLYGLKQSAYKWNRKCDKKLRSLGFKKAISNPCVYIRIKDGVIIGVYVDDLLILAPKNKQHVNDMVKHDLNRLFAIKDLGAVKRILGMHVVRDRHRRTVYIDQISYIKKFIHQFGIDQSKTRTTPINGYKKLRATTQDDTPDDRRVYQMHISKIMYAMVYTRADICYTMSRLSQYINNPNTNHEITVKHLMRYLRSTYKLQIQYTPSDESGHQELVHMYSDSDYAASEDNRRSTLSYVATLDRKAISWASRRQKSVATSTSETEYMATCQASKYAL